MDPKRKPFQFELGSLFRLTTKVAVAAGVFVLLPEEMQEVLLLFPGLWVVCFFILVTEIIVAVLLFRVCRRVWRMATNRMQARVRTADGWKAT